MTTSIPDQLRPVIEQIDGTLSFSRQDVAKRLKMLDVLQWSMSPDEFRRHQDTLRTDIDGYTSVIRDFFAYVFAAHRLSPLITHPEYQDRTSAMLGIHFDAEAQQYNATVGPTEPHSRWPLLSMSQVSFEPAEQHARGHVISPLQKSSTYFVPVLPVAPLRDIK